MNGAESLLQSAAAAGVRVCFSNPGTTEMPLVAALDRVGEIRSVLGLFEGVCTGAADGYGRMSRSPALTLLHLGPGFANGIANLHNARRAHSPIVNLIGDQPTWHLAFDAPLTSDIESLARPVSKWVKSATSAKTAADDIREAVRAAGTAPAGVSSLILPVDCQWDPAEGSAGAPPATPTLFGDARNRVASDRIERVAKRLLEMRPSALFLGGDALSAEAQHAAARIAAAVGCRVWVETFPARWERAGDLPPFERFPYFPEQGIEALAGCDSVVLAGARTPVSFFGYPGVPSQLIPDEAAIVLSDESEDGEEALRALADAVGGATTNAPATDASSTPVPSGNEALNAASVGAILAAQLPEGAIVMDEAATSGLPFYGASAVGPSHTLLSLTGGAIGQGLPCATGAAIACPDRPVIAFQADGSGLYTSQALWTQAREGLNVVTLLCSNRAYRILQVELARSGVAEPGPKARGLMNLTEPAIDWVSIATGYGVPATRANDAAEMTAALERALAEPGPSLIELSMG